MANQQFEHDAGIEVENLYLERERELVDRDAREAEAGGAGKVKRRYRRDDIEWLRRNALRMRNREGRFAARLGVVRVSPQVQIDNILEDNVNYVVQRLQERGYTVIAPQPQPQQQE